MEPRDCGMKELISEEMEGADGKAAGDHGFITCQRIGLADGARPDAIPNAAGGEGGHRAATPDVASHRYSDSPF